jgi:hypothetical protein
MISYINSTARPWHQPDRHPRNAQDRCKHLFKAHCWSAVSTRRIVEGISETTPINLQSLSSSSSCLVSHTQTHPLAMEYTWIPKDTYGNAPGLRGNCEKLIEKDLLTIEAKKQGASGMDIIGGAHQSDLDKSNHLTVIHNKRIKGKPHFPAHDIPKVFCDCHCSLQ